MQLEGRRQSTNVDDRRGMSAGKVAGGIGLGGLLIYGLITLLMGGNIGDVIDVATQMGGTEIVSGSGLTVSVPNSSLISYALGSTSPQSMV